MSFFSPTATTMLQLHLSEQSVSRISCLVCAILMFASITGYEPRTQPYNTVKRTRKYTPLGQIPELIFSTIERVQTRRDRRVCGKVWRRYFQSHWCDWCFRCDCVPSPCLGDDKVLVRWATGKTLTNRLFNLSLITLSPPPEQRGPWSSYGVARA